MHSLLLKLSWSQWVRVLAITHINYCLSRFCTQRLIPFICYVHTHIYILFALIWLLICTFCAHTHTHRCSQFLSFIVAVCRSLFYSLLELITASSNKLKRKRKKECERVCFIVTGNCANKETNKIKVKWNKNREFESAQKNDWTDAMR